MSCTDVLSVEKNAYNSRKAFKSRIIQNIETDIAQCSSSTLNSIIADTSQLIFNWIFLNYSSVPSLYQIKNLLVSVCGNCKRNNEKYL